MVALLANYRVHLPYVDGDVFIPNPFDIIFIFSAFKPIIVDRYYDMFITVSFFIFDLAFEALNNLIPKHLLFHCQRTVLC